MKDYPELLNEVRKFVTSYTLEHQNEKLIYHNRAHTEYVVEAAGQIADHYHLSEQDFFVVSAAAWLHDLGYYISRSDHEREGAELASVFLRQQGVSEDLTKEIAACILATQMPQHPKTLNEQIVCDADLFHLGTDDFKEKNRLMRLEFEAFSGRKISKGEWRSSTIKLLEQHRYHTDYCRLLLQKRRRKTCSC
ncbi:HD domain-containing protein [Arcticibacter sp. MXS-1]|uniref:HD domain-containing protein n=1 Tax=Arcticibacter sp. MXS-1 TaxID=3341726 RepID=UPI0035A86CCF